MIPASSQTTVPITATWYPGAPPRPMTEGGQPLNVPSPTGLKVRGRPGAKIIGLAKGGRTLAAARPNAAATATRR